MAPDFIVDLLGSRETADRVVEIGLILLLLLIPFFIHRFTGLLLGPLAKFIRRFGGEDFANQVTKSLYSPLIFLLSITGFYLGLTLLNLDISDNVDQIIKKIVNLLVLIGIFWAAFRMVDVVAEYLKRRSWVASGTLLNTNMIRFVNQISEAIIVILGFVVVMDELGYNLNGLLAGLGLTGLAVALAAQATLADLIGYFAIMTDEPFQIGEFIELDTTSGTVETVGFRSTRIRQLDQSQVIIPNKTVANSAIKNWSRLNKRRFDITFGIHFNTAPEKIRIITQQIRDLLAKADFVIHDGSEFAQFVEFGASSINLRVIGYFKTPDWAEFQAQKQDIQLQIIDILENQNITRALPTQSFVMNPATQGLLLSDPSSDEGESNPSPP